MQEPFYKNKKFKIGAIIAVSVLLAFVLFTVTVPVFLGQRTNAREAAYRTDFMGAQLKVERAEESELSYIRSAEAAEPVLERKLIRKADLELKVDSIKTAVDDVKRIATDAGGLVFETNMNSWSESETGFAVVKVPADKFDETVKAIKGIAQRVNRESISSEDVTEQYIDYEARLKNMKAEEASLLKLMQKAQRIEDIIAVNKEIGSVRAEIDSLEGKLNYLKSQIVMSTITVQLRTDADITIGEWNISKTFKSSYHGLINNLKGFVRFVIKAVFYLPVILLYLLFVLVCYLIIRKSYRRFVKRGDKQSPQ